MMGFTILAPRCLGTPSWELWCCGAARLCWVRSGGRARRHSGAAL